MALLQPPSFMQNRTDHTAQEDRLFLAGVMNPSAGVGGLPALSSLALVRAQASPNMTVLVARERFFIPGTENTHQGMYHGYNDADVTVTLAASSPTLPRIDIIVAYVQDQFYSTSNNQWFIDDVTGTPASSPVPPAAPANSIIIANIAVAANATSITNANITNNAKLAVARGGVAPCTSGTRPSNPWAGFQIYETDTDAFKYWTGAAWKPITKVGHVYGQRHNNMAANADAGIVPASSTWHTAGTITNTQDKLTVNQDCLMTFFAHTSGFGAAANGALYGAPSVNGDTDGFYQIAQTNWGGNAVGFMSFSIGMASGEFIQLRIHNGSSPSDTFTNVHLTFLPASLA